MFIEELHLTNFKLHRDMHLTDLTHVVGIMGENGNGKTTLLNALEYMLTGSVTTDEKQAMDLFVSNYSIPDSPGFGCVEAVFREQGSRYRMFRRFGKNPSRRLSCDSGPDKGMPALTKDKDVSAKMEDLFGTNLKLSVPAVFLRQGRLMDTLFATAAVREMNFVELIGVKDIANKGSVVEDVRSEMMNNVTDVTVPLDQAIQAYENAEQERRNLVTRFNSIPDFSSDIRSLSSLIGLYAERDSALARLMEAKAMDTQAQEALAEAGHTRREALQAAADAAAAKAATCSTQYALALSNLQDRDRLQDAKEEKESMTGEILELNPKITRLTLLDSVQAQSVPVLNEKIAELAEYERACMDYQRNKASFAAAAQEWRALTAPVPAQPDAQEHMARERLILQTDKAALALLKTAGAPTDSDTCLCCGASREHWKPGRSIPELEKSIQETATRINRLDAIAKADADAAYNYEKNKARLQGTMDMYKNAIMQASESVAASTDASVAEALAKRLALDDLVVKRLAETQEHKNLLSRREFLQAKIDYIVLEISRLESKLHGIVESDISVYKDAYDSAQREEASARYQLEAFSTLFSRAERCRAEHTAADRASQEASAKCATMLASGISRLCQALVRDQGGPEEARAELEARQQARAEAKGAMEQSELRVKDFRLRVDMLEETKNRNIAKLIVSDELQRVKGVFSRSGLPMAYVAYRFNQLAVLAAGALQEMGDDMQLKVDPDEPVAFKFRRANSPPGVWMPQMLMSGGQRVRVCVAFSFALQRLILPKLGFLSLDEPSTHVSKSYVPALANMFSTMGRKLANTSSQVWVVDHNEELSRSFGKVVRL